MDEPQEREVALGLREGKTEAWRTLYDAYAERVWRSVARLLGAQSADVADVVQETFMAAARSATAYDASRGPVWPWLWGIARRQVALHYRKQGRHDRLKQADDWLARSNGRLLRWLNGQQETPPDVLESAELAALVRAVLLELPVDYETLLTAKYLHDTTIEQIAERDKCSADAVKSKLARAREAFRHAFGKRAAGPVPP
jgi:RNA polymerase sigma-70 factor (ECF subfamily)